MADSWAYKVPGGDVVRIDDIAIEDLQRIADENGVESWFDIWLQPARYGKAAVALYRHACGIAGVDPVDPVKPRDLLDSLDRVADDLPTMWENGHPQTADDETTA